MLGKLEAIDVVIILLYFTVVLAVAWWAARHRKEESAGYFLAGRDIGWFAVGASLFVSNIGSEHLVGLAGTGAASGLAVGHFEWLAAFALLLLGWLFTPFYLRSGVYTMPEFLERRFNRACRWYFSLISIAGYVLTKISVALYAGGIIIREVTGLSLWYSAGVIVVITGVYTMVGGLKAVVYTDTMQTVVLIVGSTILVFLGLDAVGGWDALRQKAPEGYFDIWKAVSHPQFPWTGIVLGAPILALWYWCTDQYIVQRTLAARNEEQAQTGSIFAGYLKILPMFLFVVPGVIAFVLLEELSVDNADSALPLLVVNLLEPGFQGFFLAALLAALMSSLSSIFNSCSTLITWDIYKHFRPDASDRKLVTVGRIATGVLVVLGLAWIPMMKYISSQLYIYLQSVQGYIAPPIAACFLLGLFIDRLNGKGAITSLLVGFVLGAARLILELVNGPRQTGLPEGSVWAWIAEINFLHFAAGLFVICISVLLAVSYATEPPAPERIHGLTWGTRQRPAKKAEELEELPEPGVSPGWKRLNIGLSFVLVGIIVALWVWLA